MAVFMLFQEEEAGPLFLHCTSYQSPSFCSSVPPHQSAVPWHQPCILSSFHPYEQSSPQIFLPSLPCTRSPVALDMPGAGATRVGMRGECREQGQMASRGSRPVLQHSKFEEQMPAGAGEQCRPGAEGLRRSVTTEQMRGKKGRSTRLSLLTNL